MFNSWLSLLYPPAPLGGGSKPLWISDTFLRRGSYWEKGTRSIDEAISWSSVIEPADFCLLQWALQIKKTFEDQFCGSWSEDGGSEERGGLGAGWSCSNGSPPGTRYIYYFPQVPDRACDAVLSISTLFNSLQCTVTWDPTSTIQQTVGQREQWRMCKHQFNGSTSLKLNLIIQNRRAVLCRPPMFIIWCNVWFWTHDMMKLMQLAVMQDVRGWEHKHPASSFPTRWSFHCTSSLDFLKPYTSLLQIAAES